jgi:hypothetical protein
MKYFTHLTLSLHSWSNFSYVHSGLLISQVSTFFSRLSCLRSIAFPSTFHLTFPKRFDEHPIVKGLNWEQQTFSNHWNSEVSLVSIQGFIGKIRIDSKNHPKIEKWSENIFWRRHCTARDAWNCKTLFKGSHITAWRCFSVEMLMCRARSSDSRIFSDLHGQRTPEEFSDRLWRNQSTDHFGFNVVGKLIEGTWTVKNQTWEQLNVSYYWHWIG